MPFFAFACHSQLGQAVLASVLLDKPGAARFIGVMDLLRCRLFFLFVL